MADAINIALEANTLVYAAASHALSSISQPTDDPVRTLWNERLGEYLRLRALYDADHAFGELRHADMEYEAVCMDMEAKYGKGYRSHAEAKSIVEAAFKRLSAADTKNRAELLEPMWAASRLLALTPAPDLCAAMVKIEIIKREELWNDIGMTDDPMSLARADLPIAD